MEYAILIGLVCIYLKLNDIFNELKKLNDNSIDSNIQYIKDYCAEQDYSNFKVKL